MQENAPNLPQQLAALDVGASVALARRFDLNSVTTDDIADAETKLHNLARPAIKRAQSATGHVYSGEAGGFRTSARSGFAPVVVYLITRTA